MNTAITIEDVEALALSLEGEEREKRVRLERLIRAYARIIHAREPERFARHATEYGDEAGHFDNSFPPKQVYRAHNGPRLIQLRDCSTEDLPTSGGFYHEWRRVTTDPGLYVAPNGAIWGATETGTGRVGRFAAHPGDCGVEVEISYDLRDDLSLAELEEVEEALRKLAFPMSQAA